MSAYYQVVSEFICDDCQRATAVSLRGISAQGLLLDARASVRASGWILPKSRSGITLCPRCQ